MKFNIKTILLLLICVITSLFLITGCQDAQTELPEGSEATDSTEADAPEETTAPIIAKIIYDLGGAEGTAPESVEKTAGEQITVEQCSATLNGHYFGGWSDGERYYYGGDTYTAKSDVTLTARWIEASSAIILQDCTSKSGWWGTNIAYGTNSQDETPCVTASSYDDCIIFCYAWNPALNLSSFKSDESGISFDLWVEDPSSVNGQPGRFEMSAQDGYNPTSWDLAQIEWQKGWNTVSFKFKDVITDSADFSKINYIRFYQYSDKTNPSSLKMDNLKIFSDAAPVNVRYETGFVGDQPKYLPEQSVLSAGSEIILPVNDFEKLHYDFTGWSDGRGNIVRHGSKYTVEDNTVFTAVWAEHPTYTVSFDLDGGKGTSFTDLVGYEGYYVYYPDETPKKDGYVFAGWDNAGKLASSGDILYMSAENITVKAVWEPISDKFTDGLVEAWNLSDGGLSGNLLSAIGKTDASHRFGTWLNSKTFGKTLDFSTTGSYMLADNSAADFSGDFTFSAWIKAPTRTLSDRTLFAFGEKFVEKEDEYYDFTTVDNMDAAGWDYCKLENSGQKEGRGYYTTSTESGETIFFIKNFKRQNFSDYMDGGYIHMWMYADKPENIVNGQLEFTSSGGCDVEEMSWTVPSLELKEGWNEVFLSIEKASFNGGDFRPTNFNYVRFYFETNDSVTLGLDDISLCRKVENERLDGTKLYLDAENDYKLTFSMPGIEGITAASTSLDDGLWHHVMLTKEGSTLTYYVDGKSDGSCTVSGTPEIIGSSLIIGADHEYEYGFDGSMAEVKIYNKAKTPAEVTDTVIDSDDNVQHDTRLPLKRGLTFDRRQYFASTPLVNEGATVYEQDIINAMNMGFDHVKLLLTPNHLINDDGTLKIEEMEYITGVVNLVIKHDFKCYICIHPEDDFKPYYLGNLTNFEVLCRWYGELAAYIGANWDPDHVGLQLMTEPGSQSSNKDWYWFSDRMWSAVRNVLPDHTIITSSDAYGNIEGIKRMSPATDDNLIYSFTTYEPYTVGWHWYGTYGDANSFWIYVKDIPYPVLEGVDYTEAIEEAIELVPENKKAAARKALQYYIDGVKDADSTMVNHYDELYNRDWHFARAKSLDDWSRANGGNIHMMAVEWGCMDDSSPKALWGYNTPEGSGLSDETRYEFLKDGRESFEEYGIGWSYWSYNEGHTVFVAETHQLMLDYLRAHGEEYYENGRNYGISPDPETAVLYFDWELLEYALGLTPLVEKPDVIPEY